MREQLVEAFEESLVAAPDPADVLAGMRAGIARRRRHMRIGTAVGLVAAVLATGAVLSSGVRNPPAGPNRVIPVGEWTSTLEVGWLPKGAIMTGAGSGLTDESVNFQSDRVSVTVSVDNVDRTRALDQPGWRPVDVAGRAGREAKLPDSAVVVFPLPSGRWARVTVGRAAPDLPADEELMADARRVAGSVRDQGHVALRVGFAPTYLPRGQRIIGVHTFAPNMPGFGIVWCASGTLAPLAAKDFNEFGVVDRWRPPDLGPGVDIWVEPVELDPEREGAVRIADIQGRPAYVTHGGFGVAVADFHHAGTLRVSATLDGPRLGFPPPEAVPEEELIKVAEGVRWLG